MQGVDYDARVGIGGVYVLYELKAAAAVELEVGDDGICRLGGEQPRASSADCALTTWPSGTAVESRACMPASTMGWSSSISSLNMCVCMCGVL